MNFSSSIILTDSNFILTNRTCAIAITIDMSFKTALAADFKREYKNIEFLWKQRPGLGGVVALPSGVTDTKKVLMLLGDEGDGEAARGPRKFSLVLDEIEGLPCGEGSEGAFTSSVRSEPRTTASTEVVCAETRNLLRD